ncbi:hypothetical protein SRHO_G00069120 [Serrasalmus rhombeus]
MEDTEERCYIQPHQPCNHRKKLSDCFDPLTFIKVTKTLGYVPMCYGITSVQCQFNRSADFRLILELWRDGGVIDLH